MILPDQKGSTPTTTTALARVTSYVPSVHTIDHHPKMWLQGNCSITNRGTQKGYLFIKQSWHDICLLASVTTLGSLAEHLLPLEWISLLTALLKLLHESTILWVGPQKGTFHSCAGHSQLTQTLDPWYDRLGGKFDQHDQVPLLDAPTQRPWIPNGQHAKSWWVGWSIQLGIFGTTLTVK